jgi:hypothetical protein
MPKLPNAVVAGLVAEQWHIIARIQALTAFSRPVTNSEIFRGLEMHSYSGRYVRLVNGLRAAGYLRKSGWSLTKNGRGTAAWPQNRVTLLKGETSPSTPRRRTRHTAVQQQILRGLRKVRKDLGLYHGDPVDLSTESPNRGPFLARDLDPAAIRLFLSKLHRYAWWAKAALRAGLGDHPLVTSWVQAQRALGHRKRLRGTTSEKGVRRPVKIKEKDPMLDAISELMAGGSTLHSAYHARLRQGGIPISARTGKPITVQGIYRRARRAGLLPSQ